MEGWKELEGNHCVIFSWTEICVASSRVGVITSEEPRLDFIKFIINGIQKAAVFPVPVCAEPKISFPSKAGGIALAWIGVGLIMPFLASAETIGFTKPSSSKLSKEISFWRLPGEQNYLN